MLDEKASAALVQYLASSISRNAERARKPQPVTEQEKFYPCTDPLLPFPEGSLRHRYTCQVSKDSPRGEACQEREFHRDNRPLRPSSVRLPVEVELLLSPQAVYL